MAVKGGKNPKYNIVKVVWGSTEDENNKIDTKIGGDKTVSIRAGLTISGLEASSATEVTNGESLIASAPFMDVKFWEAKPTFKSTDGSTPILHNLAVLATQTFDSFILEPDSRKVIIAEFGLAEEIRDFENIEGFLLGEDGDYILAEDGSKIVSE